MDYSREIERALEVYTLNEILEYNDISEEWLLNYLLDEYEGHFTLPDPKPLDFND